MAFVYKYQSSLWNFSRGCVTYVERRAADYDHFAQGLDAVLKVGNTNNRQFRVSVACASTWTRILSLCERNVFIERLCFSVDVVGKLRATFSKSRILSLCCMIDVEKSVGDQLYLGGFLLLCSWSEPTLCTRSTSSCAIGEGEVSLMSLGFIHAS